MPLVSHRVHTCECDAFLDHVLCLYSSGETDLQMGKTDLLLCVMTMSSFPTPPLDEWWISTTQMHLVPFCFYLHCRDKVHAVHRLRRDGFDIFIEEVVEIAWWRPQMRWCHPWWQTNTILYGLTMVGTVFERIQCDHSCATHFLQWLLPWQLCFSFSATSIMSHQGCFGTFMVVLSLQDGRHQDFDHLTHFGTDIWHVEVMCFIDSQLQPILHDCQSGIDVQKVSFCKVVSVMSMNWLNQCLFSRLCTHLS